jgi:hypothetical protein
METKKCPHCRGTGKVKVRPDTWLTPFAQEWRRAYMGEPSFGVLAKYLKPLVENHGEENTLHAWRKYIRQTPGEFASVARFSQTFGSWLGQPENPQKRKRKYDPEGKSGPMARKLGDLLEEYE